MLVLERPVGTAIRIGDEAEIHVLKTGRSRVLLGIEAPRSVPVWRSELPVREPASRAPPVATGPQLRVLVVEDDPQHAELIRLILSDRQHARVTVVSTVDEAVRSLCMDGRHNGSTRPGLVLLDLNLPGRSGVELLRLIKSTHALRETPVVILSCSENDADVRACLSAGANAFVCKAGTAEQFTDSIARIAVFWGNARRVA